MTHDKPLFLPISGQQGSRRMVAAARLTLLFLGCVGLLQPVDGRYINYCPDGWSYYKINCFKYFRDVRTWEDAERQCQAIQDGAHLAWVEDHYEAATLQQAISYYQRVQPVWLGLRYSEESKAWQWAGGDKYRASNGLPGNGALGGQCGMLTHQSSFSLWSSTDCAQQHHYICKFTPWH